MCFLVKKKKRSILIPCHCCYATIVFTYLCSSTAFRYFVHKLKLKFTVLLM